jgi:hypothetical protein
MESDRLGMAMRSKWAPKRVLRRATDRLLSVAVDRSFDFCQRVGVHITPNNFYGPAPDTKALPPSLWSGVSELVGIDLRVDQQLELIQRFRTDFSTEFEILPRRSSGVPGEFYLENDLFGWLDAVIFYCMIRSFKPRRVVEVGSGMSTLLAASALDRNGVEGVGGRITAIDPFPREELLPALRDRSELLIRTVQEVPMSLFTALERNDILFIDSSHVLKIGSDVQFEYLEVIPRLSKGVLVHAHDIFLPSEYPQDWVMVHRRFWNEQYLLQAFLAFNQAFEVLWSGSLLHLRHSDVLDEAFGIYEPSQRSPGSLWFRRVRDL